MNRITVIGTGYVGLVQGVLLSEFGMNVVCMDTNIKKIQQLQKSIIPIYEPGLKEILDKNVQAGRLTFTTDLKYAVENSSILFIAVGTPPSDDGSADLTQVFSVASEIGIYLNGYKVIVNKSTVPVGTGQAVKKIISEKLQERQVAFDYDIVSNPEFLREGKAVKDCQNPNRIVIGAESERAIQVMKKVYDVLYLNKTPFVITNIETAEMIKYASNAFLAVKISFINEMALLSQKVGANIDEIAHAMGMDGRISPKFLHAGPGYGGSCFPKDTKAIADIARQHGEQMMVIEAAIQANEKQKQRMAEFIITQLSHERKIEQTVIAVWGLSFKPDTDDMRDAPSIDIIRSLVKAGCKIRAYCPQGIRESKWRLADLEQSITYCNNEYSAAKDSDVLIIMTEWNQFRGADLEVVQKVMRDNFIFDLRNIYYKYTLNEKGFRYFGVGM